MTAPEPRAWSGRVYRHLPVDSPFGPLDTHLAARSRENRWNRAGEPTLVFASSPEMLSAALALHIRRDRDGELGAAFRERQIFAVDLALERMFDLTDTDALQALGVPSGPDWFADRERARAVVGFLRHAREADGVIVPSLAFPHDPTRWELVVALERLDRPIAESVTAVERAGTFRPTSTPEG